MEMQRLSHFRILAKIGEGGMGLEFDLLRGEPRFADLLRRMKLPVA